MRNRRLRRPQEAEPILVEGLRRLEYRGYDSAGLATVTGSRLHLRKKAGRIHDLVQHLRDQPAPGCVGISHTRWATHGPANDRNAHPHLGGDGLVAVVHNGVIENYATLKRQLEADGVAFHSDTDTEVVAQLIAHHLRPAAADRPEVNDFIDAVRKALAPLKGTYGLAVVSRLFPDVVIGARLGSPLVLGIGDEENFLASDPGALVGKADRVVYLQDHQLCVLTPDDWQMLDQEKTRVRGVGPGHRVGVRRRRQGRLRSLHAQGNLRATRSAGERPARPAQRRRRLRPLRRPEPRRAAAPPGRAHHDDGVRDELPRGPGRRIPVRGVRAIPVEVEYASEFRYRNPPLDRNTIVLALTQSGETADTLAALRESKRKGHPTLALCNVVGSSIAREADGGVYLHAGPEIGVASTKAFTNQVAVLAMLALYLGRMRHLSSIQGTQMVRDLRAVPDAVRRALSCHDEVKRIAEHYHRCNNFLYLGRQYHYPVALEGALKLKEISYIHAEGYPAAEMKHGPIALVDPQTPSVFLLPRGPMFDKVMSNLEEVKARGGPVIAMACEGDEEAAARADEVIYVPEVADYLQPLVSVVPLQLLAYHAALLRGCDVDKPRNLAKSVTVE